VTVLSGWENDRYGQQSDYRVQVNAPWRHGGSDCAKTTAFNIRSPREQDNFRNQERDAEQADTNRRQTGEYTKEKRNSAGKLDKWKRPSEDNRKRSRQYIEIVNHSNWVTFNIYKFPGGRDEKGDGQNKATNKYYIFDFHVLIPIGIVYIGRWLFFHKVPPVNEQSLTFWL